MDETRRRSARAYTAVALGLALLGGCRKPAQPPEPEGARFIATTREMQDRGLNIVGPRADAVRETCKHSPEITDCKIVLSRLH